MHKRRTKLIKPRVQIRLCLTFAAVAACCIVLQFALHQIAVANACLLHHGDGVAMAAELHKEVWRHLMLAIWLLVPLSMAVGIVATFRMAGPIYHLEKHLEAIAHGEDPGSLAFRKNDAFQEVAPLLNAAVDRLRAERSREALGHTDLAFSVSDKDAQE